MLNICTVSRTDILTQLITSPQARVCVCVCLQDNAKTIEWILIKIDGWMGNRQWTNPLNFGADQDKRGKSKMFN